MRGPSRWYWTLGAAVVMVCLGWGLLPAADKSPPAERFITAERCRVKLIDEVTLASGRTGILAFVKPREGDRVVKGEQVAGLMDDAVRAALAIADKEASNDVEIRYAKAASDVAIVELEKAKDANARVRGTVPDIEVRKLSLAANRSVLQVEQAEHQHQITKLKRDEAAANLRFYRVDAPFDGIVTRVYKQMGEAVREGDPILELNSTDRVRIEGFVKIQDVYKIGSGSPVKVQLEIPDADLEVEKQTFEGKIVFVDVKVQPVSGDVRVWAEVANRGNLMRAGLNARMTVFPGAAEATGISRAAP